MVLPGATQRPAFRRLAGGRAHARSRSRCSARSDRRAPACRRARPGQQKQDATKIERRRKEDPTHGKPLELPRTHLTVYGRYLEVRSGHACFDSVGPPPGCLHRRLDRAAVAARASGAAAPTAAEASAVRRRPGPAKAAKKSSACAAEKEAQAFLATVTSLLVPVAVTADLADWTVAHRRHARAHGPAGRRRQGAGRAGRLEAHHREDQGASENREAARRADGAAAGKAAARRRRGPGDDPRGGREAGGGRGAPGEHPRRLHVLLRPKPGKAAAPAGRPTTANEIDDILRKSRDLAERLRVWTASKEIGRPLKPGLVELVKLRNQVAREMGYTRTSRSRSPTTA